MRRFGWMLGWATGLLALSTCWATATAADSAGFAPSYSGSQVMLYWSWSLAAHDARAQTFGVRYERSSPSSSDPGARFSAPLAHRSMVDLQFVRGDRPRMQFGPRVTWDISRGRIEPTILFNTWLLTAPVARPVALAGWVP